MDVTVESLARSYGTVEAVRDVSFAVPSGTVTTLLGPSGCGKTTTLRCLAGLTTPSAGTIRFGDRIVFSSDRRINVPPEQRRLGMIFQDFALWPHMRVRDNVAFGLRLRHLPKAEVERRVMDALALVRLDDHARRFPFELSGGQQQRVAVARAIVTEPELLLLDEPLSSLDTSLREEMRRELVSVIDRLGITAVLVTHDHIEALTMSSLIVVMNRGRIEQIGSPDEIYRRPANLFVAGFLGTVNVLTGEATAVDGGYRVSGGDWSVIGTAPQPVRGTAHAVLRPSALRILAPGDDASVNRLVGTVQGAAYHGDRWQYDVRTTGGIELRLLSEAAIPGGSEVRLGFGVADCVIVPSTPVS
ncbi:MAG: ABC transporter ATP-binding protein [Candidatus Limnocylindrales bacterium]